MDDVIFSRTQSGFALSIGTGLAFETLFDPKEEVYDKERKAPERVDLSDYSQVWINTATLVRNIVSSIKHDRHQELNPKNLSEALLGEIGVIDSLFASDAPTGVLPHFYYNDYHRYFIDPRFSGVQFRKDNTEAQKRFTSDLVKAIKLLEDQTEEIYRFSGSMKPKHKGKTLMLTHSPFDLLFAPSFGGIDLLESHTGLVKKKNRLGSKLVPVGDYDMSSIPLNSKTLFIFGDKYLVQPSERKLRQLVIEIATKRRWTGMTSEDLMNMHFELDIKEHFVKDFVKKLPTIH